MADIRPHDAAPSKYPYERGPRASFGGINGGANYYLAYFYEQFWRAFDAFIPGEMQA
jgi:hypothetical protein